MAVLILDRDGVINEDSDNYIRSLDDWHPIPGSIAAIAELSTAGYTIAVATNQSGLARGYLALDDLEAIHARLIEQVAERGGHISGIFYCPHLPDAGCTCRKPETGLLESIERELGVDARGAYFIGDSLKDLQTARAYGCQPVLVTTGKGRQTLGQLRSGDPGIEDPTTIPVYDNLAAAARALLLTDQPDG